MPADPADAVVDRATGRDRGKPANGAGLVCPACANKAAATGSSVEACAPRAAKPAGATGAVTGWTFSGMAGVVDGAVTGAGEPASPEFAALAALDAAPSARRIPLVLP